MNKIYFRIFTNVKYKRKSFKRKNIQLLQSLRWKEKSINAQMNEQIIYSYSFDLQAVIHACVYNLAIYSITKIPNHTNNITTFRSSPSHVYFVIIWHWIWNQFNKTESKNPQEYKKDYFHVNWKMYNEKRKWYSFLA